MNNPEEVLQERIGWLETGKPLEECLAGLTKKQIHLLKNAALLRGLDLPTRDPTIIASQRTELIQLAKQGELMFEKPTREKGLEPIKRLWSNFPRGPVPRLSNSLVSVLIVAAVISTTVFGTYLIRRARLDNSLLGAISNFGTASEDFVPLALKAPDPQSAVLVDGHGMIEMKDSNGSWAQVQEGEILTAGDQVRTGLLSSVSLVFFDGSQAVLGPNTDLSIDQLDAPPADAGPRVISLTQSLGESNHDVAHSDHLGSVYEVNTPSGNGTAQGTEFTVVVTTTLVTYFTVDDGSIAVTGVSATVIVVAGQMTTIDSGGEPLQPLFTFEGQGVVEASGFNWLIAGYFFITNEETAVTGNPLPGDWVKFEGHISPNGSRVLDKVKLLERASENAFDFTGLVESVSDAQWVVAGQIVSVGAETEIKDEALAGDLVRVRGVILEDGTYLAEKFSLIEPDETGLSFEFVGVVESIAAESWTVSGFAITVNGSTHIEGLIEAGSLVEVEGHVIENGTWLAEEIELSEEDDEFEFEFSGLVDAMEPWIVSGISFETDEGTKVDDSVDIGSSVEVEGLVLEDGTWLAQEIDLEEEDDDSDEIEAEFEFTGPVESIAPWVVAGFAFEVNEATEIDEDITTGDIVEVEGHILEDSTWLADEIEREDDEHGCMDLVSTVRQISSDSIVLFDYTKVDLDDDDIEIEDLDDIQVATVVIVHICVSDDGIEIQTIIIIYQLEGVPVYIIEHEHDDDDDDHDDDDHDNDNNNDND